MLRRRVTLIIQYNIVIIKLHTTPHHTRSHTTHHKIFIIHKYYIIIISNNKCCHLYYYHNTQGGCICVPRQDISVQAGHPRQRGVLDDVRVQYLRWQRPLEECVWARPAWPPLVHLQRVHPHLHIWPRSHHHHHIRMEQLPQSYQENHSKVRN